MLAKLMDWLFDISEDEPDVLSLSDYEAQRDGWVQQALIKEERSTFSSELWNDDPVILPFPL